MSESDPSYAVIPGVRFKATPYYCESRGLDGLARFFYEKVLPRIDELERLRRLFDLPPRLVDEILGDLVRMGYARLDVATRRIIRVPDVVPHRTFFAQPDQELWQDALTGSVIRYRDVPSIYRDHRKSNGRDVALKPGRIDHGRDYEHVPGGRLAQMLRVTSPKIATLPNGAELETVLACSHVARENLRIPIGRVAIDRRTVAFVRAPELPALLTRSWTRQLNRQIDGAVPAASLPVTQNDEPDDREPTLWEMTRMPAQVSAYVQLLADVSSHRSQNGLDKIRQQYRASRAAVTTRIDLVAAVDLTPPDSKYATHLAEMWAATRHYLLIVLDGISRPLARSLFDALGPVPKWHASVLVVEPDSAICSETMPRNVSPDLLQCVQSSIHAQRSLCMRDGVEVRLGSVTDLLDARPLLRVLGGSLASDLAVRASGAFATAECSAFVQDLVQAGRTREARRAVLTGSLADIDQLRRWVDDSDALVERGLQKAREPWGSNERAQLQPDTDDGPRKLPADLRELEPGLNGLEARLRGWASGTGLGAPLSAVYQPPISSPGEMVAEAIRSILIHGITRSLLVSFDQFYERLATPVVDSQAVTIEAWRQLLRPALEAGCIVTLYLNPLDEAKPTWEPGDLAALARLEEVVPHHLLRVRRGRTRIPVVLVIDATVVVVGHRGWFRDSSEDSFMAFDAPHLADKLCAISDEG